MWRATTIAASGRIRWPSRSTFLWRTCRRFCLRASPPCPRQQEQTPPPVTYGPTSALPVTAIVLNTKSRHAPSGNCVSLFDASADVEQLNAVFGAGAASPVEVSASVTEQEGTLKINFAASDAAIGLEFPVRMQEVKPVELLR